LLAYASGMGALRNVAWGLLVVTFDFKINELDLIADPIGWAMVLFALLKLRELHPALGAAVGAAALGLVVSVPEWLGLIGTPISLAIGLAELGVLFAVCTALMDLVPVKRHVADQLRRWGVGLAVAITPLLLLVQADDGPPGPLVILTILVAVGVVVVFVWFLVLLFQCSRLGPAASVPSLPS
jgi:hypothetical protein